MHPRAHMSLANVKKFWTNVSGAMYDGVPLASFHLGVVVIKSSLKSQFSLETKKKCLSGSTRSIWMFGYTLLTHSLFSKRQNRLISVGRRRRSKCYPIWCLCAQRSSCAEIQRLAKCQWIVGWRPAKNWEPKQNGHTISPCCIRGEGKENLHIDRDMIFARISRAEIWITGHRRHVPSQCTHGSWCKIADGIWWCADDLNSATDKFPAELGRAMPLAMIDWFSFFWCNKRSHLYPCTCRPYCKP